MFRPSAKKLFLRA